MIHGMVRRTLSTNVWVVFCLTHNFEYFFKIRFLAKKFSMYNSALTYDSESSGKIIIIRTYIVSKLMYVKFLSEKKNGLFLLLLFLEKTTSDWFCFKIRIEFYINTLYMIVFSLLSWWVQILKLVVVWKLYDKTK